MRKKIFLIAGGTGGHLFPAIALSEIDNNFEYYFLLDHRTEKFIRGKKLNYFKVQSSVIKINLLLPIYLIKIVYGFLQSIRIFLKYKADLVVGFGGYTSIPSILAAKLLKIKIIIHEQNAVMGKTNRILSYLTNNVAITFPNTKYAKDCAVFTGIPVRSIKQKPVVNSKIKRLFIIGGSQGAQIFSTLIPKIISNFSDINKKNIFIVQQVRGVDQKSTAAVYNKMKIKFLIKEFFDDIYNQFNKADLIISRCGASTLAEIELYKKSSILFPLPSAMDNHQYYNANEFQKNNPCLIFDEKVLDITTEISKKIEKFIFINQNSHKIKTIKKTSQKKSLSNLVRKIIKDV